MIAFLKSTGLKPKRTSVQAPWQNGLAERWVGSARREILDHVIALNEGHLRRLLREYIAYYHPERPHQRKGNQLLLPSPVFAVRVPWILAGSGQQCIAICDDQRR